MSKQTINLGTTPNGAGGDTPRSAFTKVQANIDELYAALGAPASGALPAALPVIDGGTGSTTAAGARSNLGLKNAAVLNAVGTMSAGDIMEVGSNANGIYTKFLNGQAIAQVTPFNMSVVANGYSNKDVLLPMDFVGNYQVIASGVPTVSNDQYGFTNVTPNGPYTASITHRNGPNAQVMVTRVTIIGYWK